MKWVPDTTWRQRRSNYTFRFRDALERNLYSGSKQLSVHQDGLVRACAVQDPDHRCRIAVESGNNVKYLETTPTVFKSLTSAKQERLEISAILDKVQLIVIP